MITLKINMITNQNYYSQILIVSYKKLKLKISKKILTAVKKCLVLVIIWQSTMMIKTNHQFEKNGNIILNRSNKW